MGAAGQQMPTKCVPMNHCGTQVPGWLNGAHPSVAQGIVMRKVCFHGRRGCCQRSRFISVQNCGVFFVYELSATSGCNMRYCGDRGQGRMPNLFMNYRMLNFTFHSKSISFSE